MPHGSVSGFGVLLGHLFFGGGDGLVGWNFGAGFVDVVNVEGTVYRDDGSAGFGARTLVLVNVLGGEIVVVAIGEQDGLFVFHGDFEQAAERDNAFVDAVPVPGNDAAGGEFNLDDRRALVEVTTKDGERDAIRCAMGGAVFLRRGFADDGFVGHVLSGKGGREKCCEEKCERERFHKCLRAGAVR